MDQAVLYTNYGAQYVYCKNGNLYISEIHEKPKNLSPVLISGAESFDIFYEADEKMALFLRTRKDTWTKMLIVKNRLMYYGNSEGSFSMSDVNLLGYSALKKELFLFSVPKNSLIKLNTENGKNDVVEQDIEIFDGGVYHYGSKTLISYIKNGKLCLYDTENGKKLIVSDNARNIKDMSLCMNNGKICVLMIVRNGYAFNLNLYMQGERPIHLLKLKSAKNCIITSNSGTLNVGICDEKHMAFMRSEKSRTAFSPVTEEEIPDVIKISYITDNAEFSASHIFSDSTGRLLMPDVLSPEFKIIEKDDDITEKLKSKLNILETELKNKEKIINSISTEFSQKQVNDGSVITRLRKSLENAEKKNKELMNAVSQLENEKRKFENVEKEIMKMSDKSSNQKLIEQNQEKKTLEEILPDKKPMELVLPDKKPVEQKPIEQVIPDKKPMEQKPIEQVLPEQKPIEQKQEQKEADE